MAQHCVIIDYNYRGILRIGETQAAGGDPRHSPRDTQKPVVGDTVGIAIKQKKPSQLSEERRGICPTV